MSSNSNVSSTPVIAIACGPTITTWDLALSSQASSISASLDVASASGSSPVNLNLFDGNVLAGKKGTGVVQFRPHSDDAVVDLAWNHNGQVIASCSDSIAEHGLPNVVLTHYSTQTKLESLSNFHTSKTAAASAAASSISNSSVSTSVTDTPPATSITFGGKNAKSRYLCVSDKGGAASVWDMKKISRVRCFRMKASSSSSASSHSNNPAAAAAAAASTSDYSRPACVKSCMDPTDTHVVALHGDSILQPTRCVALELFHLKTGSRVATLRTKDGMYGGGADTFCFSHSNHDRLCVGSRDGSLLLWDISKVNSGSGKISSSNGGGGQPMTVLERRHRGPVTDVAFSPVNGKELLASCSMDGTVAFHDLDSKQTIQTIRPHLHLRGFPRKTGKGLTSFAFHHDGYTWACGTEEGLVFTYDLRQSTEGPLCTLDVNSAAMDPVNCIQFMQTTASSSVVASSKTPKSTKKIPAATEVEGKVQAQSNSQAYNPVERTKITSSSGVTKPKITRKTEPAPYNMTHMASPPAASISKDLFPTSTERPSKSHVSTSASKPPPISSSSQKKDLSVSFDGTSPKKYESTSTVKEPYNLDKVVESSSESYAGTDLGDEMIKDFDGLYERIKNRGLHTEDADVDGAQTPTRDAKEETGGTGDIADVDGPRPSSSSAEREPKSKSKGLSRSDREKNNLLRPSTASMSIANSSSRTTRHLDDKNNILSKSQVQEMVDDAVEGVRDDMEEAIQSLHCEFLKQLQKQANEISIMLEQEKEKFESIQIENAMLKEENDTLKKFF
uniref:Uncharacterized protein n=1 Tax=Chaetoceros debilis TaxID=122233 RepID=A0A7S3QHZ8_9STRA|mmetsp:Transcript_14101/g.21081  ORF Transcript_14101/g.21081 Transcript_14101/m.21081 type:complete len:787 (+) Transcript_14101:416-2776(+)